MLLFMFSVMPMYFKCSWHVQWNNKLWVFLKQKHCCLVHSCCFHFSFHTCSLPFTSKLKTFAVNEDPMKSFIIFKINFYLRNAISVSACENDRKHCRHHEISIKLSDVIWYTHLTGMKFSHYYIAISNTNLLLMK